MEKFFKKHKFLIVLLFSVILLIAAIIIEKTNPNFNYIGLILCILGYLIMGFDMFKEVIEDFKEKKFFTEDTLTIIASIAAMATGDWVDGLIVMILFNLGEHFEDYALDNSRKNIEAILKIKPSIIHKISRNKTINVKPETIKIGDCFLVKHGEIIPVDGIIIKGSTSLNTSSLTGESLPVSVKENDQVLSGVINLESAIIIKATKEYKNSTVAKILDLIENSDNKKTSSEKFITKFAKIYTPIVILLAFSIAILPPLFYGIFKTDWTTWKDWILRGASMLVISCPCALVISIPMSFVVSLGIASKNKIIIKGTTYLELLSKADSIFLDKTGTITVGDFVIDSLNPVHDITKEELLKYARYGECFSNHPIAKLLLNNEKLDIKKITKYREIAGKGVICLYNKKELIVGSNDLLKSKIKEIKTNGTILHIEYDKKYLGYIVLKDKIKESSINAINKLSTNGFKNITILSGDNKEITKEIANKVGIKNYYYKLLPIDKTEILKEAKKKNETTVFIGDGINDAPSLIISDIGISMGQIGSDSAIEASDIVFMDDDLNKINYLKQLARLNNFVVRWNIIFSITIKIIALILNLFGLLNEYAIIISIFADVGVTIICCINSLLIGLKRK